MVIFSVGELALMATVLLLVVYIYLSYKYCYWRKLGVPFKRPHILFGNMKDIITMRRTEAEVIDELCKEFHDQPFFGVYYLWRPILVINDTELIKAVMVTDFEYFPNHQRLSNLDIRSTDAVTHSLFMLRDREWRLKRALFAKYFTPKRVRSAHPVVDSNSERLIGLLEEKRAGGEVEVESLFQKYAVDVVSSALFGLGTGAMETTESEFIRCGRLVGSPPFSSVLKSLLYLVEPNFSEAVGLATFHPNAFGFFGGVVSHLIEHRRAQGLQGDDLLATMIKMNDSTGETSMSFAEVVGHVFSFFVAGYDTTTVTLSYTAYELSRNQDVQDKLRKEVQSIISEEGGILTIDAVQKMSYLEQVVSETLRMYPPVGVLKRECTSKYMMGGQLNIPVGSVIAIPVSSLHRDPRHFPSPCQFIPERFNPEQERSFTYMPFGKGPRTCIGMKLAELEIKTAVAMLVSRYRLGPSDKTPYPARVDPRAIFITCRPLEGIWVTVEPLDK